jgi:cytidylate kinase
MKKNLVIAIDGPSASGKGTLAKKIAAHFGLAYLNTGAVYRLIALRVISQTPQQVRGDILLSDEKISELTKNISESDLESEKLFGEDVGAVASVIAKNKKLRAAIFDFQRDFVERGKKEKNGCVLDGRDTTTVICPDADFKFFVTADVEIRAQRRFAQLKIPYEEILAQLKKRDENDLNRVESPLKIAPDAVVIDNGKFSIEEGFRKILGIIQK